MRGMKVNKENYAQRVLEVLMSNPTAADLDFLVEAYTTLGYLAGEASGEAEMAEAKRKYEEANAYSELKRSGEKITDAQAQARAVVDTWAFRTAEIDAQTKAKKLAHLLDATREAINAIKYLGRYDSSPNVTIGR